MNDQHEDIDREFEVTDDGKLRAIDDEPADFEEDLTFDE
jgi:hypothetical protein